MGVFNLHISLSEYALGRDHEVLGHKRGSNVRTTRTEPMVCSISKRQVVIRLTILNLRINFRTRRKLLRASEEHGEVMIVY